jgi:quercetin dioxygenase-like cupin family protein
MTAGRRAFLARVAGATAALLVACGPAPSLPGQTPPAEPTRGAANRPGAAKPVELWDKDGLDRKLLFQQEVDRLPESPHMLRVTELEMSPGASIDPHTHLGPGVQVVLKGAFTSIESATGRTEVYEASASRPFPVFGTGMLTRYSLENRSPADNRLFMVELLPRSREFLGNQQFDTEGTVHNQGGVRSGPYAQEPIEKLPDGPLMLRVTQIDMGPKAKTTEYTRPGPAIFFVVSGQATFRRQSQLWITTTGAGGYFFEDGSPIILENKPITPNRLIAVELLPASLGKQPSTIPTGREL